MSPEMQLEKIDENVEKNGGPYRGKALAELFEVQV